MRKLKHLIEANQAMIKGGAFTATKSRSAWRACGCCGRFRTSSRCGRGGVFDESDEAGNRFVQAFMSLSIGESTIRTTRAEGTGPMEALTKAMRHELEKWYPAL